MSELTKMCKYRRFTKCLLDLLCILLYIIDVNVLSSGASQYFPNLFSLLFFVFMILYNRRVRVFTLEIHNTHSGGYDSFSFFFGKKTISYAVTSNMSISPARQIQILVQWITYIICANQSPRTQNLCIYANEKITVFASSFLLLFKISKNCKL